MFTQKKLLREIYNAQPVKGTKKKKPKHDVGPSLCPFLLTLDTEEPPQSNKQGTKHYATPPLAAEPDGGQQGQLKKETTPEGYTRAATTDGMSEPRARAARQKGQLNFGNECKFYRVTPIIQLKNSDAEVLPFFYSITLLTVLINTSAPYAPRLRRPHSSFWVLPGTSP